MGNKYEWNGQGKRREKDNRRYIETPDYAWTSSTEDKIISCSNYLQRSFVCFFLTDFGCLCYRIHTRISCPLISRIYFSFPRDSLSYESPLYVTFSCELVFLCCLIGTLR